MRSGEVTDAPQGLSVEGQSREMMVLEYSRGKYAVNNNEFPSLDDLLKPPIQQLITGMFLTCILQRLQDDCISSSTFYYQFHSAKEVNSNSKSSQNTSLTTSLKVCDIQIPVMVSADSPDTDAADWLRVKQASVIWVNQGQHAILEHQQHPFAL